jgi:alkanesulfonate monooxygenase SsuD/methylene tetrahydromethanopterin reductase-like flavin-dependent oxidoreductase (luciferase family)
MRFVLFIMGTRSGRFVDILDQISYAEKLGFYSVLLAERHFNHGDLLFPSPLSVGAAIAARTDRIRIGTAARILPLDHPLPVAHAAATLDILSGGRLDFGATRASLDERCHQVFNSPLDESRGRFEEALEVITLAWTQDHFRYDGTYYQIDHLADLPRPVQRPHPPITLVAVTPETTTFAARKGYAAYLPALMSPPDLLARAALYAHASREAGHDRGPAALGVNRFIYVSESDSAARREIRGPFLEFLSTRAPDLKAALLMKYGTDPEGCFDRCLDDFCLFGAPSTVAGSIAEIVDRTGLSCMICSLNLITLEHDQCIRSMELFAEEVMPQFVHQPSERRIQGAHA